MKRAKYILVVFSGTFIYILMSLFFGVNSLHNFRFMEEQKVELSKQKAYIQNINSELELELTALRDDKAVIAAYARKLGYVASDEKIIKITGLKPSQTVLYDTGKVLRHQEPVYVSEKICKIVSLVFSLMVFALLLFYDIVKGNFAIGVKKHTPAVTGIPVYDLPQI
ncbi:MAG: septum formation initiator family protein [Treponema sp.]|nr:septum formation initiator family protein [Treponema sp.]